MVVPLNEAYISMVNAFKGECDKLLDNFKEKHTEDFREFAISWKTLKFNLIYEKYSTFGMKYDFKEDSLQIAKCKMFNDYFVGGIFLLYGLYFVQEDPKARIRLELYEFEKLLKLIKEERNTLFDTCQSGFLFSRLLGHGAFVSVRFGRDFSMEGHNRSRLVFSGAPVLMHEDKPFGENNWLEEFLGKLNFIEDLQKVEEEYYKQKLKLKEEHPELNLALGIVPDDIISEMKKNLTLPAIQEEESEIPDEDIGHKRKRLKGQRLRFKCRYTKSTEKNQNQTSASKPTKKRRLRGKVRHYFESLINEPETDSDSEDSMECDESIFNLTDIN